MKRFKIFLTTLIAAVMVFSTPSCKKSFLDRAPGVDINENTIFTSKTQLNIFLATIYRYTIPSILSYGDTGFSGLVGTVRTDAVHGTLDVSDEGDCSEVSFIASTVWNSAGVLPSNITQTEDTEYFQRWYALRQIALMLKRVDEVPDLTAAEKTIVKAEVKALRALVYFELVKRYGGVPIINEAFDPGVNINSLVPRASIEDVFNFIVKDCTEAIADLPATRPSNETGRLTSLAARAVKAKALLYAASPLFNTATPYLGMSNAGDNKLVCYGNSDVNRWKLAADAAKDVIDKAEASNVRLVDVPANRTLAPANRNAVGNYSNMWETKNNSEIILIAQGYASATTTNPPLTYVSPTCFGSFWSGITATLNFVRKYEKLNGTPQTWDAAGGTDLLAKIDELDPRFKQTLGYTESYWNPQNTISEIYTGGKHVGNCLGGFWMHKLIPRAATPGVRADLNDFVFRLGEFYLDYAEAQNEFTEPGKATNSLPTVPVSTTNPAGINFATAEIPVINTPYDAINKLRLRSGMPPLPASLDKNQFRNRVRNERNIELCYEEHRFWDIKRWMIAENEGVMQGAMEGIRITKVATKYTWVPYNFETRTWLRKMYLHPFPQAEVLKGGLTQNPGW